MLSEATTNIAAPVSLADYTRLELIVPRLRERDTAGIISELSQVLQRQGGVPDVLPFYQAALNQEMLANSAPRYRLGFAARAPERSKTVAVCLRAHAGRRSFGAAGVPGRCNSFSCWPSRRPM